ncbi:MAG: WYL domain-containing protein [Proteobacteria bacterium]|nr:WYL domain-containing protein [Pseudomonadota bacterium]MBU1736999.1 WYL domain-containing protein [Pseudomonadota bacterium]
MTRNKIQLQRLIFIDQAIREGMRQGVLANRSTMAARYEVSPKSIGRDIDYLKHQMDAPIEYDQQKHGYFYTEETYKLPAISISESDLFAICVARKALKQHENTPVYRKLVSVFRKIEQSLPDKVSVEPSWVDDRMSVLQERGTDIDPATWDKVAEALHHNRRLRLSYLKPGDTAEEEREIDPYHVVNFQGEWYVAGFCHRRRDIRIFALSRIKAAETLKAHFTIPDDFSFARFAGHHFGIFRGEKDHRVEIHFAQKHTPYVLEREWHPEQSITHADDGSVTLSFTSNHLFEVKRWILSWGSGVRVLAPPELVDAVRLELEEALQAYH